MEYVGTNEAEKIIEYCVSFNLLPDKKNRASHKNSQKVSNFKSKLKLGKNENTNILISLIMKLIKGQRTYSPETKNEEEYKQIVNDLNYIDMSPDDICVNIYRSFVIQREQRNQAVEDLYNQRIEYERIIENKKQMIKDCNTKINELNKLNNDLHLQNDYLRDKILSYDSDSDSAPLGEVAAAIFAATADKVDYNKMDDINNLQAVINSLQEKLEDKDYEINILKGKLNTCDIKCSSEEEEDKVAEEAKLFFSNLEKQNEEKRLANRKKFGMI
jgi:hypothetical protein